MNVPDSPAVGRRGMALTIQDMTAKERLHRLVDELTETEARRTRIVVEDKDFLERRRREIDRQTIEGYTRFPPDEPDEWGDLQAQTKALAAQTGKRLDEDERSAGHEPW
jgi:hypothetical protein